MSANIFAAVLSFLDNGISVSSGMCHLTNATTLNVYNLVFWVFSACFPRSNASPTLVVDCFCSFTNWLKTLNCGCLALPTSWKAKLSLVVTTAPSCRKRSSEMGTSKRLQEDIPSATMYGTYGLNGEGGWRRERADCRTHICACGRGYKSEKGGMTGRYLDTKYDCGLD